MPDLDPTHAIMAAAAAIPGLVALMQRKQKLRGDAYDDARKDLDECKKNHDEARKSIDALNSSHVMLSAGLQHCKDDHAAAHVTIATLREKATKQDAIVAGLRSEMDGLRRSITGDQR